MIVCGRQVFSDPVTNKFYTKNFGNHLVIVYAYLWLQAAPYDCTNIVHKEITL